MSSSRQPARGTGSDAAEVADRLHSAAIHLLRFLRRQDQQAGLSAPRLSALSVVVVSGPVTLGDLAAAEQVRPPTMSRLVAGLERDGLVARKTDATDRRVVWVHPTPKGVRILAEGRTRRVAVLTERLRTLPLDDLEAMERAVRIVESLLKDPD